MLPRPFFFETLEVMAIIPNMDSAGRPPLPEGEGAVGHTLEDLPPYSDILNREGKPLCFMASPDLIGGMPGPQLRDESY